MLGIAQRELYIRIMKRKKMQRLPVMVPISKELVKILSKILIVVRFPCSPVETPLLRTYDERITPNLYTRNKCVI